MTQRLQARLRLATQIAALTERLAQVAADARDADAKWANKLARGADLVVDDDANHHKSSKSSKRPSPDEQRLQALTEKLCVLLAQPIVGIHTADAAASSSSTATVATSAPSDAQQHRSEKLKLLGIVTLSAAVGAAVHDDARLSAQTQWLDAADGAAFGGDWTGAVRHGASKDSTSLALRRDVCACRSASSSSSSSSSFLAQWQPNREPADADAWGGAYGKVCGHNEVVMQRLRPFFPQEVLNSRVCSARWPAPGNRGFDGCLEFLRLATMHGRTSAMTVWDAESFLFFTPDGRVTAVKKTALLALPLAGLQCLLQAMRQWTLLSRGQLGPQTTLLAIRLCCAIGAGDVAVDRLATESDRDGARVVRRILSFAVGGSQRVWRQIARLPLPLERDVLYA
ncbi:hypothetical protein PINS_up011446 [Pythium insidiosum]|nr:hypothetical protein PINS_up011446 [Pythium insidiosum]